MSKPTVRERAEQVAAALAAAPLDVTRDSRTIVAPRCDVVTLIEAEIESALAASHKSAQRLVEATSRVNKTAEFDGENAVVPFDAYAEMIGALREYKAASLPQSVATAMETDHEP